MKYCTVIPIKDQKAMYVGCVESTYRALNTEYCYSCQRCRKYLNMYYKGCNVLYIEGVQSSSKQLRAVMPMHVKGIKRTYTHFYS